MSDIQSHMFARCLVNAARRINGFPIGHRLRDYHGHTFRIAALAPLDEAGPQAFQQALAKCVAPMDFGFLGDVLDRPTDERMARWIVTHLEGGSQVLSTGVRSADPWICTINPTGGIRVCHTFQFEAAHWLPAVPADHQCARLHGHRFSAAIVVDAAAYSEDSMQLYERIMLAWQPIQQSLEGNCLNDIAGLENPTSEVLAEWVWQQLQSDLEGLTAVIVCETGSAGCHFDGQHFSIWKDQLFESALPNPGASTSTRVTGRSYRLRLHLRAPLDEVIGWVHDFGDVRESFRPFMQQLDHHQLDDLPLQPPGSSLGLARWLMQELVSHMPKTYRIDLFDSEATGIILKQAGPPPLLSYPLV